MDEIGQEYLSPYSKTTEFCKTPGKINEIRKGILNRISKINRENSKEIENISEETLILKGWGKYKNKKVVDFSTK